MARSEANIPQQLVLADALASAIRGRKVRSALFATFEFEPEFFELNVLPCLFADGAWSQMPNVKRQQVGDALRGLNEVAVFFDRRGLKPGAGSARLDYERVALARSYGVFHAKNILLLLENNDEHNAGPAWESLVLFTTSANLTRCGWHENLEVAQVMELMPGDTSAVRGDLLHKRGLLSQDASPGSQASLAIEKIRRFLREEAAAPGYLKQDGLLRPRLYVGREAFPEFLCDAGRIGPGEYCLEIVSPFFDNTPDARTLAALLEAVKPIETRVYLPVGDDGKAQCTEEYSNALRTSELLQSHEVHWGRLPEDLTRWSRKIANTKNRNVHAKVYRLFKGGRSRADWREIQVVGSVNLTGAAHAGDVQRNFETAMLVEMPCQHEPDWWMKRLGALPQEFIGRRSEDDTGTLACHELTLQYDWQDAILKYFWKSEPHVPQRGRITANDCPLFDIEPVCFDRWCDLGTTAAEVLRSHLTGSSLVELAVERELPQPLLVQELNMARKPSLLEELTAAEILEYWSLLTPERRNEYLERKLADLLERAGTNKVIPSRIDSPESLFDRFAGIFHAFSCLEEHVLEALRRGAEKEARYRLLGESYDSLPTLVRQVQSSADTDRIVSYVTLLCASQVFGRLRSQLKSQGIETNFLTDSKVRKVCDTYEENWREACKAVKREIVLEDGVDNEKFFTWYEESFSKPVKRFAPTGSQEQER